MNVELYIEGNLIELSNQLDYTINKTFKDYLDPTAIKTDFSKTIEVPFTPANNVIFGNIYKLDKQQIISPDESMFINIDPAKKLSCKLLFNQEIIFSGYCKLNSITNSKDKHTYNINIFGELGIFFSEMKKIIMDKSEVPITPQSTEEYTQDYFKKYGFDIFTRLEKDYIYIDKRLINDSFNSTGPSDNYTEPAKLPINFKQRLDILYKRIKHKIGFAPVHQGLNPKFDSSNLYSNGSPTPILSMADILANGPSGLSKETVQNLIGNGFTPRAYGEYRSYYQRPFIYMNQFIMKVIEKMQKLTGYNIELDPNWFSPNNPYWFNLVRVSKMLDMKNASIQTVATNNSTSLNKTCDILDISTPTEKENITFTPINKSLNTTKDIIYNNKYILCKKGDNIAVDNILKFNIDLSSVGWQPGIGRVDPSTMPTATVSAGNTIWSKAALIIDVYSELYNYNKSNDTYSRIKTCGQKEFWVVGPNSTVSVPTSTYINGVGDIPVQKVYGTNVQKYSNEYKHYIGVNLNISDVIQCNIRTVNQTLINKSSDDVYIAYTINYHWLKQPNPASTTEGNANIQIGKNPWRVETQLRALPSITNFSKSKNCRSNQVLDTKRLLGDVSVYDIFIQYLKMFNLIIWQEYNTIHIDTFNNYFRHHNVYDYSDKLDRNKDYILTPLNFDNKYIKFNYDNVDVDPNNEYKDVTNFNYGELTLSTNYNFNNETKNLFKKTVPFIPISPSLLDWDQIYSGDLMVGIPKETMGCFYKKDGTSNQPQFSDYGGCYALFNGIVDFDKNFREVYITDDSIYETIRDKYMYHLNTTSDGVNKSLCVRTYKYPLIQNLCGYSTIISPSQEIDLRDKYNQLAEQIKADYQVKIDAAATSVERYNLEAERDIAIQLNEVAYNNELLTIRGLVIRPSGKSTYYIQMDNKSNSWSQGQPGRIIPYYYDSGCTMLAGYVNYKTVIDAPIVEGETYEWRILGFNDSNGIFYQFGQNINKNLSTWTRDSYEANIPVSLFNIPSISFSEHLVDPIVDKVKYYSIYDTQYKKYYDELYNLNNSKLECSIYITPQEFRDFKFSNFITIDNVLFFINKIIDYNPSIQDSTKMELIKVTNINNYIDAQKVW